MTSAEAGGPPSSEGGESATSRRLPYLPGIDGLRAIAVIAVVLYHAAPGSVPGGFFGVDVFFVISGYLITSLLLADRGKQRGVGLRSFWWRRARRLLPAVAALIAGLMLYTLLFLPEEVAELRADALASATYVTNWYLIFDHQSYFETFQRPSLLRHLWSLAIEEQFYIFWPLVLALVLPRFGARRVIPFVLAAAIASWVSMALLYQPGTDPSRVYYGTDTRAGGLLIGALLAFVWSPWAEPLGRRAGYMLSLAGVAALAGIVLAFAFLHGSDSGVYWGGFPLVWLLAAVAVAAAARPATSRVSFGKAVGILPLAVIGLRSYSIYLWHWPVLMLTRPHQDVALDGLELWALRLGIIFLLAELSYRFIEAPVRKGALGRYWRWVWAPRGAWFAPARPLATGLAVLGGCLLVGLRVGVAERPEEPSYLAMGSVSTVSWSDDVGLLLDRSDGPQSTPHATAPPATSSPTPAPPVATAVPTVVQTRPPTAPPTHPPSPPPSTLTPDPTPPPPPPPPPLGGRVLAIGDSVMLGAVPNLQALGDVEVDAAVGRQFPNGTEVLAARRDAGTLGEIVVVHLGHNMTVTAAQFDQMMSVLQGVQRVVFVTVKVPRDWEGPNNALLASKVSQYGNATLADWYGASSAHPEYFWDDGIHLRAQGAQAYAALIAQYL